MGSAIAAHLANAGISVLLLDVRPSALLDDERSRGLTLDDPQVRNRFAAAGKQRALHAQPAAFFIPARAQLVETGNFDDHLSRIAEADWVLEAVVEDLPIKQQVLAQVARYWKPGTVVSTNTSGLPVREIAAGCPDALRHHFLGTHFFNPPRYLRLLELIPLPGTDPQIVAAVSDWGDRLLGKGIVQAHYTPNFIANRIGSYGFRKAVQLMLELGLSIEEVDELTGPVLGRPRSATFRTTDLVGLDTVIHVSENSYRHLTYDEELDEFVWRLLSSVLVYAARRVPEIADDVVNIDRAMRWGYAWDLGPFETWDVVGVEEIAKRLDTEDRPVPPVVRAVLERGEQTFYRSTESRREYFDLAAARYRPVEEPAGVLVLASVKSANRVAAANPGASLIDLGDGIACLEFHSKLNTIGEDTIRMITGSLEELQRHFDGLVIGNQSRDFSAGANLMLILLESQDGNWDELDQVVRQFQRANLALRYSARPVVAAPFGRTLGGGCEICLGCARIHAAAETYMGLVETGAGLVPAGGGTAEMVRRVTARLPDGVDADPFPLIQWAYETIATARVSASAEEARVLGFLRDGDGISMNSARLIQDAKDACLALVRAGYQPPLRHPIRVVGDRGLAAIEAYLYLMRTAGSISEYDTVVGGKLAHVMCGGRVPYGTTVTEEYLHDLEREAFLSLAGQPKTQERMRYILQTGKPLRN